MGDRNGPTLAIVGNCARCEHLARGVRDPALRGTHTACVHPSRADGGTIFAAARGKVTTPAWCPRLSAASQAKALEMLAPTFVKDLARAIYESDNGMGSGDLHDLLASIGGEPHDPEVDDHG